MKRTALYEKHRALGAKLVPFGGFEMPRTIRRSETRTHDGTKSFGSI